MQRAIAYLIACLIASAMLFILVSLKSALPMQLLWLGAWSIGVVVTWRVARRQGRRPIPWVLLALAIGPIAWIVMATNPAGEASLN